MPKKKNTDSKKLDAAVLEVFEQAFASSEIPEVGIHFARLLRDGHSVEEAKRLIGTTLVAHLFVARKEKKAPNWSVLRQELAQLPMIDPMGSGQLIDFNEYLRNRA